MRRAPSNHQFSTALPKVKPTKDLELSVAEDLKELDPKDTPEKSLAKVMDNQVKTPETKDTDQNDQSDQSEQTQKKTS